MRIYGTDQLFSEAAASFVSNAVVNAVQLQRAGRVRFRVCGWRCFTELLAESFQVLLAAK